MITRAKAAGVRELKRLDSVRETVGDAGINRRRTTNKKDRHSLDKIECTKADNRMREGRQGDRNPRIGRQRQAKYEVETFIDDQA